LRKQIKTAGKALRNGISHQNRRKTQKHLRERKSVNRIKSIHHKKYAEHNRKGNQKLPENRKKKRSFVLHLAFHMNRNVF